MPQIKVNEYKLYKHNVKSVENITPEEIESLITNTLNKITMSRNIEFILHICGEHWAITKNDFLQLGKEFGIDETSELTVKEVEMLMLIFWLKNKSAFSRR